MGTFQHHAIVVVGWSMDDTLRYHTLARSLDLNPTPIVECKWQGYSSFLIPPDGGKEERETSRAGDERRAKWRDQSAQLLRAGPRADWVEVSFGELGAWVFDPKEVDDN